MTNGGPIQGAAVSEEGGDPGDDSQLLIMAKSSPIQTVTYNTSGKETLNIITSNGMKLLSNKRDLN